MSGLEPGTICKVLERAGIAPPDGAYTRKTILSCIWPDKHDHGDRHKSAYLDGPGNGYGCAKCGNFSAKMLAERLNVPWPLNGSSPVAPRPAPSPALVREAVKVGITLAAAALPDDPAIKFLESRGLEPATHGPDPVAIIWPADGAGLPECYASLARRGYLLAARLYDARSGALASLQARFTGEGGPPGDRKTMFPPGADQARGKVFANLPAVAMMRGSGPNAPRRVIVGEGLTDFLALSLACPDDPVVSSPGASVVQTAYGAPTPRWIRPGLEVISALDGDEPGEVGAKALADACRSAGAIVRRLVFREGQKDACDIVRDGGIDALRAAINAAEFPACIRHFGASSRSLQEYRAARMATPDSLIGRGLLRSRQFGMLFGGPGFGKTWVAMDLAISVASGRDWFGIPVRAARVGYLSLELERWDLTARLDAIMAARLIGDDDVGDRLHFISPPDWDESFDLMNPDHRIALQVWIKSNHLELCIVDTLTRAHSADERDLRPIANAALEIVRRTDSAMMFVHHPRKPGQAVPGQAQAPAMYESRGDSRWLGDAKFIVSLSPRRKVVQMTVDKTNTGAPVPPIYLKAGADGVFRLTELPKTKQEQAAEARASVMTALEDATGPMSRASIAGSTGMSEDQVKRALAAMVKDGTVEASGKTSSRVFSARAGEESPKINRPSQEGIEFIDDN